MRTATKQQVIDAADICAQWGAEFEARHGVLFAVPPRYTRERLAQIAWLLAVSYVEPGRADAEASSILYAAALESGPLPEGWELVDETARGA